MLNVGLPQLKIIGKCARPFMSSPRCTNCKKFDACHDMLEKSMKGEQTDTIVIKDDLIKKEAWKDVSFRSAKGRKFLMKIQSAKLKVSHF